VRFDENRTEGAHPAHRSIGLVNEIGDGVILSERPPKYRRQAGRRQASKPSFQGVLGFSLADIQNQLGTGRNFSRLELVFCL
jgi:hypothetical protein